MVRKPACFGVGGNGDELMINIFYYLSSGPGHKLPATRLQLQTQAYQVATSEFRGRGCIFSVKNGKHAKKFVRPLNEAPTVQLSEKEIEMNRFCYLSLLFLAAGICFITSNAVAQEQRRIVLNTAQFKESFLEKVTVSGGIRAGFMYQSSLDHIDIHQLYVHLLHDVEEQDAMLCVNMVSRDGRYSASWEYALGKQPAGAIAVDLPSKYQEQVAGYAPEALVVLAAITKKDCASSDLKYVPTSWGESKTSDYILYVNSGNTDTIIGIPGHAERIQCSKIIADSTIAYDTRCVVGKDILSEPKSIFLVRNNFGNRLPNVEFPVR